MKLKDIVPYCIQIKNGICETKYYWMIAGSTYQISKLDRYYDDHFTPSLYDYQTLPEPDITDIVHLSEYNNPSNTLTLNLNNDITIFDNFIIVHKTDETVSGDVAVFRVQDHYIDRNTKYHTQYYILGLWNPCGMAEKNLRTIFKDLIEPVAPKVPELTLDEKVDDLIDTLMEDSRGLAIKQLKRMLNERL